MLGEPASPGLQETAGNGEWVALSMGPGAAGEAELRGTGPQGVGALMWGDLPSWVETQMKDTVQTGRRACILPSLWGAG